MKKTGKYKVTNIGKYRGDRNNITYRSSWELRVCKFLDEQNKVIWWSSEELAIPYRDPASGGRIRRYFPDFVACINTKDGKKTYVIEVKPHNQTAPPKGRRKTKRFLREAVTWSRNDAKWKAARSYCNAKGWVFLVVTEHELFGG